MAVIPKRWAFVHMLDFGSVLVALDPTYPGVVVPYTLNLLRVGYNLAPPIPDLEATDDELIATLSFNGKGFRCVLPWGAILALRVEGTDHVIQWPQETEVQIEIEAEEPPPPRHLKLVD